ncbi:MAG: response regulator [Aestuariibacter sp.]
MQAQSAHIIEDDVQMVDLLRQCLLRYGFSSFIVSSTYKNAEEQIANKTFDVVILDIHLQDGNGLQLMELIKKKHPKCKVLVCSGNVSRENVTAALEMGADGILAKPFNFKSFETVLKRADINFGKPKQRPAI